METNQLTSHDDSNIISLTDLYCSENFLTALDLSGNTTLGQFYCNYNQLTSLDVSNQPDLIRLSYGGNQLTSLDLTNNSNLDWNDGYVGYGYYLEIRNMPTLEKVCLDNAPSSCKFYSLCRRQPECLFYDGLL